MISEYIPARSIHSCVENSCIVLIGLILHKSVKSLSPTAAGLRISLGTTALRNWPVLHEFLYKITLLPMNGSL